jgi:hypothetical protein
MSVPFRTSTCAEGADSALKPKDLNPDLMAAAL